MCSPEQRTRLPKQWKYWAKKAGLKPSGRTGREYWDKFFLTGRDRCWRINDKDIFECSCPIEHFDRWANSRGAEWIGIPKDEKEFLDAVKVLIDESRNAK